MVLGASGRDWALPQHRYLSCAGCLDLTTDSAGESIKGAKTLMLSFPKKSKICVASLLY